ncbi:MAG: antitoxin HicB [Desulfovibrio sp.]|nr:MAG: antitoxin HicB [Desulfovibrio sp.]
MNAFNCSYQVIWSEPDQEYVGLCEEYPSLSWLDADPGKAFKGIVSLVQLARQDMPLPKTSPHLP